MVASPRTRLDGLFVTPTVTAIGEALSAAGVPAEAAVVVVGDARLAAALRAPRRDVIAVGVPDRAAKKLGATHPDTSTLDAGAVAALVAVDVTADDGWPASLRAWTRVVADGGVVVLVDKGHAAEASRRALCSGLTDIEQRHAGRTVVTSGRK